MTALTTIYADCIEAIREGMKMQQRARVECPDCDGQGYRVATEVACCGRVHELGYCATHCAVSEEVQYRCDLCGGSGFIEELPSTEH